MTQNQIKRHAASPLIQIEGYFSGLEFKNDKMFCHLLSVFGEKDEHGKEKRIYYILETSNLETIDFFKNKVNSYPEKFKNDGGRHAVVGVTVNQLQPAILRICPFTLQDDLEEPITCGDLITCDYILLAENEF